MATSGGSKRSNLMRMTNVLIVFVVFGATMLVHGATRKVDFSDDTIGQPPKGFEFAVHLPGGRRCPCPGGGSVALP